VPVVVVLSSRQEDSDYAKVYERQREAPESVALGDLPNHVMALLGEGGAAPDALSTIHRELSKSNSTCSTSDTNANGGSGSGGASSSSSMPSASSSSSSSSAAVMTARLVVSPGLFSAKDPRREVYRKRTLIEDKLASLLQSLFAGTVFTVVAGDESADNSNSHSNSSNNNDGTGMVAGPVVFAANTSLANLQFFHGVLTERVAAGAGTARTLDLETFTAAAAAATASSASSSSAAAASSSASSSSEAVAREQRQWLKPLLSYLRGSHSEGVGLFLYSIPDDDCVVLQQRILAS
jgi:hypothetical protein